MNKMIKDSEDTFNYKVQEVFATENDEMKGKSKNIQ